MWDVSERFKQAIPKNAEVVTTITATPPGGTPTTLRFTSGSCTVDRTQRIRRTAALSVKGGDVEFGLLSTPGTRVAIEHGIAWSGTDRELVPMIVGELSAAAKNLGEGVIAINVADLWQALAAATYLTTYTPAVTALRTAEISQAVRDVFPTITIVNTSTDTGAVATSQAWTSRADLINTFATDGGTEAFFAPDGTFLIRDQPQITDQAVWVLKPGAGGTIKSLTRNRPLDQLYNTVIVQPGSLDGSQTWTQVVAQITDPTNPRHPDKIGVRPYLWTSPTILTTGEANDIAVALLAKVQGTTETLALEALTNAALEGGDIVRVLNQGDAGNEILTHFTDGLTVDLATGAMTVNTRSDSELQS